VADANNRRRVAGVPLDVRRLAAIVAVASVVAIAVVVVVVLSSGGSRESEPSSRPDRPSVGNQGATATLPNTHPRGVRLGCSSTSSAGGFRRPFADPGNLVVDSLVLAGAAEPTPRSYIRAGIADHGIAAVKFPLFVVAGHSVTVQIPRPARRLAGLAYAGRLRDADHTLNFVSCSVDRSRSRASGLPVTFWPGGLVTERPACVPLDVYVDDEPSPQHVAVSLGRPCDA